MWATADWDSHPGTSVILKCKEKKTQLMFCHWWRQTGQIIDTNFSFKFSVWNFSEIPSMVFLLTLFNVCNVICNDILLLHPRWPCSRPLWGEHNGDQRAPPFFHHRPVIRQRAVLHYSVPIKQPPPSHHLSVASLRALQCSLWRSKWLR